MNTQIFEEASAWLVRNREGDLDAEARRKFDDWLRESPQHVRAYLEMSATWEDVSSLDPGGHPAADVLIAWAHAADKVIPLQSHSQRQAAPTIRAAKPRSGTFFALAASLLLAIAAAWFYLEPDTFATDIGEQRTVTLEDGSTIQLNARSRIRVAFQDHERDIELLEGQALFHVARDASRPFVVHSNGTRVRALGTSFDVNRARSGTTVTVLEGRVEVLPTKTPALSDSGIATPGPMLLGAGEQVTVSPTASAPPRKANVLAATAWTLRKVVFDNTPIADVAEEFNRYNEKQLVVNDAQVAGIRISGVFSSSNPELLLRFLREQPEITVQETDQEIRISRR